MAEHDLPFPSDMDDWSVPEDVEQSLAGRLQASYAAVPPTTPAELSRAVQAVLAAVERAGDTPAETDVATEGATGEPPMLRPVATSTAPAARSRRFARPQWWWGAAAAAVLVVTVARPWRPGESQRQADSAFTNPQAAEQPVGSTRTEADGEVRFDLTLPADAREVSLVGDFNGWDESATPMVQRGADGTWSARVPLTPGRHTYAFVVDGQRWLVDPLAPQVPDAGFGPTNAVIVEGAAP